MLTKYGSAWFFHHNLLYVEHLVIAQEEVWDTPVYVTILNTHLSLRYLLGKDRSYSMGLWAVSCLGRFQRARRPAAFWWRPVFFKKLKWRPVFFWWRPMTPCYNFYFAPNVTVHGNRRGNYACGSLFYSTAFMLGFVYVIATLHYVWHWFRLGEL